MVDVNELSTEKANFLHYFVQYQAGDEDVTEERLQEVWDTAFARKLNLEQKNKVYLPLPPLPPPLSSSYLLYYYFYFRDN